MREYDDDIRIYSPIFRRIMIVLAVFAAVPVVLWSITEFVRSYVAPPKAPTFHQMAATNVIVPQDNSNAPEDATSAPAASPAAQTAPAAPIVEAKVSTTDAHGSSADIITPSANTGPQSNITTPPPHDPYIASPAAAAPPPVMSPTIPGPSPGPLSPGIGTANAAPATDGTTGSIPSANSTGPAQNNAAQVAASEPDSPDSADALPAAEPLTGPIPLPPHRPKSFTVALTSIPIPRPRPESADPAQPTETSSGPLDWLGKILHPSDQAAPSSDDQSQ